jgi:hypothetical protein
MNKKDEDQINQVNKNYVKDIQGSNKNKKPSYEKPNFSPPSQKPKIKYKKMRLQLKTYGIKRNIFGG